MATVNQSLSSKSASTARERPAGGVRFDLYVALLSLWFIVGLYIDGYAHNHGAVDNTFFTPYHALLYSGILATGLFLGITQYRNIGKGYAFTRALPYGYNLSLIGVGLFFVGGGFDLRLAFAVRLRGEHLDAAQPVALLLATSGFLILSGPLRAAWRRKDRAPTWGNLLPGDAGAAADLFGDDVLHPVLERLRARMGLRRKPRFRAIAHIWT